MYGKDERDENLKDGDDENSSAARSKEQPCLLQLRLSIHEDKETKNMERIRGLRI